MDNVDQDALIFCLVGLAVAGGYIFPAVATEVSLRKFSFICRGLDKEKSSGNQV